MGQVQSQTGAGSSGSSRSPYESVICIGYEVPGYSEIHHKYSTRQSLLDADFVIFEPIIDGYTAEFTEGTGIWYRQNEAHKIQEDTERWKAEIETACRSGRTVFVFFGTSEEVTIETTRSTTGSGQHTRTDVHVTGYNNYGFLPIELPPIIPKEGSGVRFMGNPVFSAFWSEFKSLLCYESYIDGMFKQTIFQTKSGCKTVGAIFKIGAGHLVLLPPVRYDEDSFLEEGKKGQVRWTDEARQFGETLLKILRDIDWELRSASGKTPPPAWASRGGFGLAGETDVHRQIAQVDEKIATMNEQRATLYVRLENEKRLRDLLFEKGKPLEVAIIEGLRILGYRAEGYDDGELQLDQVILSPEGDRFVGEAEGKDDAPINIDKLRQLTSNITEDAARKTVDHPAIGILFGNGYRLKDPAARPEQFTAKCVSVAHVHHCALVTTADLFNAARYVKESGDQAYATRWRDALRKGIGIVVQFPEVPVAESSKPPAE